MGPNEVLESGGLSSLLCILHFVAPRRVQIAWGVKIRAFLRDFDMISMGDGSSVEGHLYARRFEASSMIVLPITIGKRASVGKGAVVYGGTHMGDGRYDFQSWIPHMTRRFVVEMCNACEDEGLCVANRISLSCSCRLSKAIFSQV